MSDLFFYTKHHLKFGKKSSRRSRIYVISAQIFSCILLVFSITAFLNYQVLPEEYPMCAEAPEWKAPA